MKKRVLCVCIGGTVRSVGIKDALNGTYGCNALAASAIWQDEATMRMLCEWADIIVPVVPRDFQHAGCPGGDADAWRKCIMWDSAYDHKRRIFNIGEDEWGNPRHPDLVALIHRRIAEILG